MSALFGEDEDEAPIAENGENAQEIKELQKESDAMKNVRKDAMTSDKSAEIVFDKLFKHDIERLASVTEMWKSRTAPKALSYSELRTFEDSSENLAKLDQKLWTLQQNVQVFTYSLHKLIDRMKTLLGDHRDGPDPSISFDKDDEDTLDFVTASANIRAHIFGIEMKTKFQVKQMAGNIIPAIATTNAIIAGVCVIQAFKVLSNDIASTKTVFLSRRPERVFNNESIMRPNTDCTVCGVAQVAMTVNVEIMTLQNLVDVLRDHFGYGEEISILTHSLIYDPDFDDNLEKTLKALSIHNGTFLTIIDDDDEPRINLQIVIIHDPSISSFILPSIPEIRLKQPKKEKRKRSPSPAPPSKKIRIDDGFIELD